MYENRLPFSFADKLNEKFLEMIKKITCNTRELIALSLLICIAFVIRFYNITYQSYWLDEIFSAGFSNPSLSFYDVLDLLKKDIVHPYFYQLTLWIWYKIFGYNELTGRLYSCLWGSFAIPAIYFFVKYIFNKKIAWITIIFFVFNYQLILYSQETRSYSMLIFFVIISSHIFFKVLDENRFSFLYILTTGMLLNTHYFGYLIYGSQCIIFAYDSLIKRKINFNFIKMFAAIIIFMIPLADQISNISSINEFWVQKPDIAFLNSLINWFFPVSFLPGMVIILILLAFKKDGLSINLFYILFFTVFPALSAYLYSVFTGTSVLENRYLIIILPFIIIMTSVGVYKIYDKRIIVLLMSLVVILSLLAIHKNGIYSKIQKDDWRGAIMYLDKNYSGETVYSVQYKHWDVLKMWYKINIDISNIDSDFANSIDLLPQGSRIWIIDAHHVDPLRNVHESNFTIIKSFDSVKAHAILLEKK